MVTITKLTPSSNHLCLVICLSAMMTKYKVCKAVWSHRAMLHLAVPDKARNSTTLSPPSVHRPVSQHPSLWTTPPICLSSLLWFWEVLPLHKNNRPTILQKSVKCLHLRIKKFYPFRIKLYEQKILNYVILTISFSPPWYTTHTRPALLCRLGPLCTFAPPLLHPAICSSGPTHTPLFFMPSWMNALETGSRCKLLTAYKSCHGCQSCPEIVYAAKAVDNLFQFHSC